MGGPSSHVRLNALDRRCFIPLWNGHSNFIPLAGAFPAFPRDSIDCCYAFFLLSRAGWHVFRHPAWETAPAGGDRGWPRLSGLCILRFPDAPPFWSCLALSKTFRDAPFKEAYPFAG